MSGQRSVPAVPSGAALGAVRTQDRDTKRSLEQEDRAPKRQRLDYGGHGSQKAPNEVEAVTLGVKRHKVQAELQAARNQAEEWKAKFEAEVDRRQELERSCAGLKDSLRMRYYEMEDLKRGAEAAQKERDAALDARRTELKVRDKLQDKLKASHNKLSKYGNAAAALASRTESPCKYLAKLDKRVAEYDKVAAERDMLRDKCRKQFLHINALHENSAHVKYLALSAERDQIVAEREKLLAERDELVAERDKLVAESNKLAAGRSRARTTGQQWRIRAEEVAAERDSLLVACEGWEAWEQDRVAEREELDAKFEQVSAILDGERIVHTYTRGESAAVSLMIDATEKMVADRDKKIESLQEELDTSTLLKRLASAWDDVMRAEAQADMYQRQAELLTADLLKRNDAKKRCRLLNQSLTRRAQTVERCSQVFDQEKQLISLTDQKGKLIEEIERLKRTWQEERKSAAHSSMRELDDLRAENLLLCTELDDLLAFSGRLKA